MAEIPAGAWGAGEAELRAAAARAADIAVDHLVGLREQPVFRPFPPELAARWREEDWSDDPSDLQELLRDIATDVLAYPFGNGHGRFHAWVNPPPDRAGVLAAMLAAATNPSVAGGNHASVHLERQVIRWLCGMVGLPGGSGGVLLSGGSLATIVALAAARQAKAPFDARIDGLAGGPTLAVHACTEVHSCVTKAVELLGIGRRNLRLVDADPDGRLDPARLREALEADERHPIAVVASAGSVSRGAIDPLEEIAAICRDHDVWLHVDGAYGAPAVLSERYAGALAGLSLADSVAVDPHKWLYVPVDAGALLVREPERLREAFTLVPSYLQVTHDPDGISDAPWIAEYTVEQTRPFRALRVWAALKSTGRAGYRALVDHDLDRAVQLAEAVAAHPELTLDSHRLSIVCFSCAGGGDDLQADVARRIQLGGEAFLTTTVIEGRTVLRACFVNPLTTTEDVDALVELVARTARGLRS